MMETSRADEPQTYESYVQLIVALDNNNSSDMTRRYQPARLPEDAQKDWTAGVFFFLEEIKSLQILLQLFQEPQTRGQWDG